jgi:cell division protein FtsA
MRGVRLEVEVLNYCVFSPYLGNLNEAVLNADLGIDIVVPSPLAASEAVLTPRQKELGVLLIDIGAATTSIAVFEEGHLLHSAAFPVGSSHITNDIAIGLKVDVEVAERIKKEFGTCVRTKGGARKKKIKILQGEEFVFSQKSLLEIIEARVLEIFEMVNQELKKIDRQGKLPAGVILTGGGARLREIEELAKKELKLATKIGIPQRILGIEEDPQVATLAGLVIEAAELEKEEKGNIFQESLFQKAKKIFKTFLP